MSKFNKDKFVILKLEDMWDLSSEELDIYEDQCNGVISKLNMIKQDIDEVRLYTESTDAYVEGFEQRCKDRDELFKNSGVQTVRY